MERPSEQVTESEEEGTYLVVIPARYETVVNISRQPAAKIYFVNQDTGERISIGFEAKRLGSLKTELHYAMEIADTMRKE